MQPGEVSGPSNQLETLGAVMSGKGFVLLCQHHSFFAVNGISDPYLNNHGLYLLKECGMIEKI